MIKNRPFAKNNMMVETSFNCTICGVEMANRIRERKHFIEPEYITCHKCGAKSFFIQLDASKYKCLPVKLKQ